MKWYTFQHVVSLDIAERHCGVLAILGQSVTPEATLSGQYHTWKRRDICLVLAFFWFQLGFPLQQKGYMQRNL